MEAEDAEADSRDEEADLEADTVAAMLTEATDQAHHAVLTVDQAPTVQAHHAATIVDLTHTDDAQAKATRAVDSDDAEGQKVGKATVDQLVDHSARTARAHHALMHPLAQDLSTQKEVDKFEPKKPDYGQVFFVSTL